MKMHSAMEIINNKPVGFMVSFEWKEGGMLRGDYFPERGEELIKTEKEAWILAAEFAKKTVGDTVNLYVVNSDFTPVDRYRERYIENRRTNRGV